MNSLLERQIITMMNMVPYKDMCNSTNMFTNDFYDSLSPLQLLKGNSLTDLKLNDESFITFNLTNRTSRDVKDDISKNLLALMSKT
jgi:hypothetical protein